VTLGFRPKITSFWSAVLNMIRLFLLWLPPSPTACLLEREKAWRKLTLCGNELENTIFLADFLPPITSSRKKGLTQKVRSYKFIDFSRRAPIGSEEYFEVIYERSQNGQVSLVQL
jgi:hypothetical protein